MNNKNKMIPKFIEVKSSNIEAIAYTKSTQELKIRFRGGITYKYEPISLKLHHELMAADSKGVFFITNIKNNSEITCTKL